MSVRARHGDRTPSPAAASASPPARGWSYWGLLAAALLVPWLIVGTIRTIAPVPHVGYDLELLGRAATRLVDGLPVYLDASGASFYPGSLDLYYGPPAYLLPWLPLAHLPGDLLQRLAYPLGVIEVAAALALLVRAERDALRPAQVAAIVAGAAGCWVVFAGVTLGASSTLTLLFVAGSWFYLRRGADVPGGIVLGTIIAWRVYPVALILPLLVARRWRAAGAAIATSVAWTAAGALVVGQGAWSYPSLLLHLNGLDLPGTASPAALAAYLLGPGPLITAIRVASIAIGAALLVVGGVVMRATEARWRLTGWGLACAGCLLLPGVIWDHYLTLLLILAVGLVVGTGRAWPGLLPVGIVSTTLGGGIALLWMPVVAIGLLVRRSALPAQTLGLKRPGATRALEATGLDD